MSDALDPRLIPEFKKLKYLETFSEDDFRDRVLRPLFLLQGLISGRDTCGTDEEGKDCYFWQQDPIRGRTLIAVQTKRGKLSMASTAKDNLLNAMTQVKTAVSTLVADSSTKQSVMPSCVILAASGVINHAARKFIVDEVKDSRVLFKDANDLIPLIDELMPEFWNGIDATTLPYLKSLRKHLLTSSVTIDVSAIGLDGAAPSPITDEAFAQIYVNRIHPKTERHGRDVVDSLVIEELAIQDVLKQSHRLILLTGDAGAGKSTALFRLALVLLEQCLASSAKRRIPVVLSAKDVLKSDTNLAAFAGHHTIEMTIDGTAAFDDEDLRAGRVELLIDGLDELGGAEHRTIVLEKIKEFHNSYPLCQIIASSRDYVFVRDIVSDYKFERFRITAISYRQASKMIARLAKGQSLSQVETEETLRRLEDIHGLQLNPLLITVFVATSEYSRSDIPANITEIFKKFTEVMLGRWGITKGVSQQYLAPFKDFVLRNVAFEMHCQKETSISAVEFKAIVHQILTDTGQETDVDALFEEIVYRSGLMRECDGELEFVACSPKADPCVMRVPSALAGKETLDERQEAQSGADRQEAA